MKTIRVLQLQGCKWCESLISQLNDLKISYSTIDANDDGDLADRLEDLLNTTYYPIVILETPTDSYYLYRPSSAKEVGITAIGSKISKVGCLTVSDFVTQIKQLI
jgi:glutaredoxin